jgi:hypothetical protein
MTVIMTPTRIIALIVVVGMLGVVGIAPTPPSAVAATATATFTSTGTEQTFTVPADVTTIYVVARGASGAQGSDGRAAGRGAVVAANLAVTPGQVLYVNVGGLPTTISPGCYPGIDCLGGFNGGGSSVFGGGGGGASDIRTTSGDLSTRLIVAAGGGGSGAGWYNADCRFLIGGAGGDAEANGGNGDSCNGQNGGTGGGAGTASAGGSSGLPAGGAGSLGQGGNGGRNIGGGGGGGFYGGGGGGDLTSYHFGEEIDLLPAGGGGGGSNLVPTGGTAGLDETGIPSIIITYEAPDTTPPDTSITAAPVTPSPSASAAFSFEGTDDSAVAGFECSLDGGSFTACISPQTYIGLTDGSHTFEVRAVDTSTNVDPTPDSHTWTVDTTDPTLTVPDDVTVNATGPTGANVTYPAPIVSDVSGATVSCTPPSGSLFPIQTTTVDCLATDGAGNTAPGSFTVTIIGSNDLLTLLRAATINDVTNARTERTMIATLDQVQASATAGNVWGAYVGMLKYIIQLDQAVDTRAVSASNAQELATLARQALDAMM